MVRGLFGAALASTFAIGVALVASAGCGVIVGATPSGVKCSGTGAGLCAVGEACVSGTCQLDRCANKSCDGGACDPATGNCGTGPIGECTAQNCPAPKGCNPSTGKCEDVVPCTPQNCPAPKKCTPDSFCVDPPNVCTPACTGTQICDSSQNRCIDSLVALGQPCSSSPQCVSGICGDGALLTTTVTNRIGSVCTKGCCSSADCQAGAVCHSTGQSRYCVPKAGLATDLGPAAIGSSCTADNQCSAGLCLNGVCSDICCSDAVCGGLACVLTEKVRGGTSYACQPPPGPRNYEQTCNSSNTLCRSNSCIFTDFSGTGNCTKTCCGVNDCKNANGSFSLCKILDDSTSPYGAMCSVVATSPGKGEAGTTCTSGSSCRSSLCYTFSDGVKRCSDVCCVDTDCSADGTIVCRPYDVTPGNPALRCVPKL